MVIIQTNNESKKFANKAKYYLITKKDLPLSCPMPNMESWNSHPRVYLPIEESGSGICPYCSTKYILNIQGEEHA